MTRTSPEQAYSPLITVNLEIFANRYKRHICHIKNLLLGHDLHTSVEDRVILLGFYFAKIKHLRKYPNLQKQGQDLSKPTDLFIASTSLRQAS